MLPLLRENSGNRVSPNGAIRLILSCKIVNLNMFGRLAQLVERVVDVDEVRGSIPLPPTNTEFNGFFKARRTERKPVLFLTVNYETHKKTFSVIPAAKARSARPNRDAGIQISSHSTGFPPSRE